jgi:hypothetical protein
VELELVLDLNAGLFDELKAACRETKCTPRQFILEATESVLASRRLEGIKPQIFNARLPEFEHEKD